MYDATGGSRAVQTFNVGNNNNNNNGTEYFQYVQLEVRSNHGYTPYSCLYRFRVHGEAKAGEVLF